MEVKNKTSIETNWLISCVWTCGLFSAQTRSSCLGHKHRKAETHHLMSAQINAPYHVIMVYIYPDYKLEESNISKMCMSQGKEQQ